MVPRLFGTPRLQRRLEHMPRQDGEAVEQSQAGSKRLRETDDNRARVWCADVEGASMDTQVGGEWTADRRIVGGTEREQHVGGRQRLSVGELHALSKRDRVGQPIVRSLPTLCQPRLEIIGRAIDSNQSGLG